MRDGCVEQPPRGCLGWAAYYSRLIANEGARVSCSPAINQHGDAAMGMEWDGKDGYKTEQRGARFLHTRPAHGITKSKLTDLTLLEGTGENSKTQNEKCIRSATRPNLRSVGVGKK